MSREPSSSQMRYAQARGGWDSGQEPPPPPTPPKRKIRVIVEPAKPKPIRRSNHADERANFQRRQQAVTKLTTTTEALTAEEQNIVRGYRLSIGGPVADEVRRQIEQEARRR